MIPQFYTKTNLCGEKQPQSSGSDNNTIYGVHVEFSHNPQNSSSWPVSSTSHIRPREIINQFSSVTQSCPTLWDPMNCSTPGLPVYHQLPEFTQTHIH